MLPYIPQDLPHPQLQAWVILRNGVPPRIRRFVMEPMLERTVGDMMDDILQAKVTAHMSQLTPMWMSIRSQSTMPG
ncbi:hypothetical protein TIFTF001_020322 [Ficus carica]|uniref:Uncharacterized protein n=1 Tax=Ficus carica TaxID=3494 RepID=A0AA88DJK6_FICCA|nr:hypothetical protein TIFTF001_020322 [Ficus carica]